MPLEATDPLGLMRDGPSPCGPSAEIDGGDDPIDCGGGGQCIWIFGDPTCIPSNGPLSPPTGPTTGPSDGGGGGDLTQKPKGPVCVSPAQINTLLANTPLAGEGQVFYDAGQKYNVNPGLAVAIAGAESTFGEQTNATWGKYNAWGWGNSPSLHAIGQGWTNWSEGIFKVSWQLGASARYLNAKSPLTTTAAIYANWCTTGCAGGVDTINAVLGELGVQPTNSLTFAACIEEGN